MCAMRVLLLTENLGSGGAERQLTGLAVLLKEKGYQVRVITYVKKQFYEPYLKENQIDYKLVRKAANKYTRVYYIWRELCEYNPDVIISFLPSVNITVCLVRLIYVTRLVISERSHTMHWNLMTRLRFLLYSISDKLVANSYSEANNIISHCPFLKKKTIAIPNFVDTDYFVPSLMKKRGECFKLVCVGRVIPEKNLLRFIDAIDKVRNKGFQIKVLWIGSLSNQEYVQQVIDEIRKLDLVGIFELHDHIVDIIKVYQSADAFCLPSLYEGYPNVICEAMSCGLPVVCSNVCEMPEIVKDGINGFLFNPLDEYSIVDAILRILNIIPQDLIEMGYRNRQQVIEQNSKFIFLNRYVSLLEK